MKREPYLLLHRSDHDWSTPTNLPRSKTATQGGTQRQVGYLAELEEPKEGGSFGDASKKVNGARMRIVVDRGPAKFSPRPENHHPRSSG
jgi:hypothetical protein